MTAICVTVLIGYLALLGFAPAARSVEKRDFTYIIPEEAEVDTFVGNILLDSGLQEEIASEDVGIQLYEDRTTGLFRVDKHTGKLLVAKRIDREAICPQKNDVQFVVEANTASQFGDAVCRVEFSAHIPPQHWINIIAIVKDINDHAPKFQQAMPNPSLLGSSKSPYVLYISEGVNIGYQVPLVGATDEDDGDNGIETYSLNGKDFDKSLFSVSYQPPYELNLVVQKRLDHEKKTSYSGLLTACDGGKPTPLCANQVLTIFVTDVNDNKPVFEHSQYEVKISENMTVGSLVTTIVANDADSGEFGRVKYRMGQTYDQSASQFFDLDERNGQIRVRQPLQAKFASRIRIPIIAQDGGPIPKTGATLIQIDVEDVNNHPPWLQISPITTPKIEAQRQMSASPDQTHLWLEENQPIGTQIGIIVTGDKDVGANSNVSCSLSANNSMLVLRHFNSARERKIYSLQSNIRFDREAMQNPSLAVSIECSDAGSPSLTTRKTIQVNIQDVNEFPAHFPHNKSTYIVDISEDALPGTLVVEVQAVDKDATAVKHYSLTEEVEQLFRVEEFTGRVFTIGHLDREHANEIRFGVKVHDEETGDSSRASDSGPLSGTDIANVTVRIADVNDNAPRLEGKRIFQVFENRPAYADLVGQIMVSDPDAGENGTLHFSLLSVVPQLPNHLNGTFEVNSNSGAIYAKYSLDRELHAQYQLRVEISDMGTPVPKKVLETITVDVLDENDNRPVWRTAQSLNEGVSVHKLQHVVISHKTVSERASTPLAYINVTEKTVGNNPIVRLIVTDMDTQPNANFSFQSLALHAYEEGSFFVSGDTGLTLTQEPATFNFSQVLYIDQQLYTLSILPGVPVRHSLLELSIRVSDNGNPPLHADATIFLRLKGRKSLQLARFFGELLGADGSNKPVVLTIVLVFLLCSLAMLSVICVLRKHPLASFRGHGESHITTENGRYHQRSRYNDKKNSLPKVFAVPDRRLNGDLQASSQTDVDGCLHSGQFYLTQQWLSSPMHQLPGTDGLGTPPMPSSEMSNSIHGNIIPSKVVRMHEERAKSDAERTAMTAEYTQQKFGTMPLNSQHFLGQMPLKRTVGSLIQMDLEAGSADSSHCTSEEETHLVEARKGYFTQMGKFGYCHGPILESRRDVRAFSNEVTTFGPSDCASAAATNFGDVSLVPLPAIGASGFAQGHISQQFIPGLESDTFENSESECEALNRRAMGDFHGPTGNVHFPGCDFNQHPAANSFVRLPSTYEHDNYSRHVLL